MLVERMNWHAVGSRSPTLFWSHSQRSVGHPSHYLCRFLWNYQCITYILLLITTPYLPNVFSNILSSHAFSLSLSSHLNSASDISLPVCYMPPFSFHISLHFITLFILGVLRFTLPSTDIHYYALISSYILYKSDNAFHLKYAGLFLLLPSTPCLSFQVPSTPRLSIQLRSTLACASKCLLHYACPSKCLLHYACPSKCLLHYACPSNCLLHYACPSNCLLHYAYPSKSLLHHVCPFICFLHRFCPSKWLLHHCCPSSCLIHHACPSNFLLRHVCLSKFSLHHACSSKCLLNHACPSQFLLRYFCSSKCLQHHSCISKRLQYHDCVSKCLLYHTSLFQANSKSRVSFHMYPTSRASPLLCFATRFTPLHSLSPHSFLVHFWKCVFFVTFSPCCVLR